MATAYDTWKRTPEPEPADPSDLVAAKLNTWLSDADKVANALDDLASVSDHAPSGATHFSQSLAYFLLADDRAFERDARRLRDDLLIQVAAQMRAEAEIEVSLELDRLNEGAGEATPWARGWAA